MLSSIVKIKGRKMLPEYNGGKSPYAGVPYDEEGPLGFAYSKMRNKGEFINLPGLSMCLTPNKSRNSFKAKGTGRRADFVVSVWRGPTQKSRGVMITIGKAYEVRTKSGKRNILFNIGSCTFSIQQYDGNYRTTNKKEKPDFIVFVQKRKQSKKKKNRY